jgi:predicted TIM-barrel fold metal-dependent hydrolase
MMIDAFCHILTPKFLQERNKRALGRFAGLRASRYNAVIPTLSDLNVRFKIMDKYPDYVQVLSTAAPAIETICNPDDAAELAKIANDELAEMVLHYPDRFVGGIACVAMNNINASLNEIDRAINDLRLRGIQVHSDIAGKPLDSPEFVPVYEKMAAYNLPIFIHPVKEEHVPDYPGEEGSKYLVWNRLSWPHQTSVAMMRISCSGILERYPNLKFVTHHAGGTVPYLWTRIRVLDDTNEMILGYRYEARLTKKVDDYLRMFYNDTAVYGNAPSLMCAYAFCGADHLIFATDMPFGNQLGERLVRETIRSVNEMSIGDVERKMIFEENARKLMRLPI